MSRRMVSFVFGLGCWTLLLPLAFCHAEDKPGRDSDAPPPVFAPFDAEQAGALQAAWARHLKIAVEQANSLDVSMVLIPPGEFQMGSGDEQIEAALKLAVELKVDENTKRRIREAERPRHRMTIDKPFRLAATEVTIAQFGKFVTATGYRTEGERFGSGNASSTSPATGDQRNEFDWRFPGFKQEPAAAVSQVTWNDAVAFCNWLSEEEKLTKCYRLDERQGWLLLADTTGYRLPTEAEWEYAARAGSDTQFHFGDSPTQLSEFGWFGFRSGSNPERLVGVKRANPWKLFDMHGNVGEWCEDHYVATSYPEHFETNPPESESPSRRVIRGGDWWGNALRCRSAFRGYGEQTTRSDDLGFRVARTL